MKRLIGPPSLLFVVSLFWAAVTPGPSPAAPQAKLVITGTGSAVAVMQAVAQGFQTKYPGATVEIPPSIGSGGGIKAVREGKIDIGLSSRPLKPEERSPEVVEEEYGRTAFLFGTQASNPEEGFTLQEIEEIYAGKRTTWRNGSPLRLVLRPASDSYTAYLAGLSSGMRAASEKAQTIPGLFVGATDQDAVAQIEKTPGALGVTSACIVAAEKRRIKGLRVDGVAPTLSNVSSGVYPYAMTLHVVYRKDSGNPAVKAFLDFLFSVQGREILTKTEHAPSKRTSVR